MVRDTTTGRSYTPRDYRRLLTDAGLPSARAIADHYIGFVKFADRAHLPSSTSTPRRGQGSIPPVGAPLPNLSVGQVFDPTSTPFFTRPGDINQEDITNDAVRAWRRDALLPVQPHRQPGHRPLLAPEQPVRDQRADHRHPPPP